MSSTCQELAAVEVTQLSKTFTVPTEIPRSLKEKAIGWLKMRNDCHKFEALKQIDFSVAKGETFGIVGANGSGKSTLFKLLCGVIMPDGGGVRIKGRLSAIVELTAGFHNELTGRENIFLNGAIYGMSRDEIQEKIPSIVAFADIGEFMDARIRTYSSGMLARLAFALAINVDADVLLFDEVLAVGDISFRERCIQKIHELRTSGKTVLYVSHDLAQVEAICDRVMWLHHGECRQLGNPVEVLDAYRSQALQSS